MPSDSPQHETMQVQPEWTTARLLTWLRSFLESKGIDSPRLTAELLLAHVIGCERLRLYMEADRPASSAEREMLRGLVRRVAANEPVQYVVGEGWFYGRPFFVDASTLIPRPSTETLVEHVIRWVRRVWPDGRSISRPPDVRDGEQEDSISILDVGTGTGCIGITLLGELPQARLMATDVHPGAIALALRNAERHAVSDRIEWREGSLFQPLSEAPQRRFSVIVSNPPYILDSEWNDVPANVRGKEPETALRGGPDGLSVIRPLIQQAPAFLEAGGLLAVEIAHATRDAVIQVIHATGAFERIDVLKDGEGLFRVLRAERAGDLA